MIYRLVCIAGLLLAASLSVSASTCVDTRDTYDAYDDKVKANDIRNIPSEYYVLTYSWSPRYCQGAKASNKQPGGKDFLQCDSRRNFGYIVHGLWPQGRVDTPGVFPRACEGDQEKIHREVLDKYLCMTPSRDLLQHEWEFHGTCMHDEALETPDKYFAAAENLHRTMTLPENELPNTPGSRDWFYSNNSHLAKNSIKYLASSREWLFCFNNDFASMPCPGSSSSGGDSDTGGAGCPVKGNISNRSGKRLYFTPDHRDYAAVKINKEKGERCFADDAEARAAGWKKAP